MKALIFDFDGLMVDTETADYQSWLEVFHSQGVDLPFDIWAQGVGTSLDIFNPMDYLESLVGGVDHVHLKAIQKQRLLSLIDRQPLLPGVQELIARAQLESMRLAIASTSSRGWVTRHLAHHGLEGCFTCIKTGDQVARVKPYPDIYLAVLEELQIEPHEALVLEDSPNGIIAAKAAGLYCVVVPNLITRQMDIHLADLRLESLSDLLQINAFFS